MSGTRRSIRVANVSGAFGDWPLALWTLKKATYDAGFLRQLDRETADIVAANGIKIIHDGGTFNLAGLAAQYRQLLESYGITSLKVAYVEGDNVLSLLDTLKSPSSAPHLDIKGRDLSHITKPIVSANAFLGMSGIIEAPTLSFPEDPLTLALRWLAGSLLAGHFIECGCYATGGNFSGFKSIPKIWNQGFPVLAEIKASGDFEITPHDGARGLLVYEIQGSFYLNPDVVADITDIQISHSSKNRVSVTGFTGAPPPPTTKLAVCMQGGFQIEYYLFATGLEIVEKLADL
ncbi:hypothetical protein J3E74DRAFT_417890 [Bipolaris maydis]|nr:hypothetical protein J3E74DRAFT_417890 [Bipolaris maydis]